MKLYELPRDAGIKIKGLKLKNEKDVVITFHHIDGMYSYCTIDGMPDDGKNLVHLGASTELKKIKDHYVIVAPKRDCGHCGKPKKKYDQCLKCGDAICPACIKSNNC